MLPDGTYDVFVVDATTAAGDRLHLDLTVLGGEHKGEVVAVEASGLGIDELDALGRPGTLAVSAGEPTVTLEH